MTRSGTGTLKAIAVAALGLIAAAMPLKAWAGKADDTLTWATTVEVDTANIYYQGLREVVITSLLNCDSLLYNDPETNEKKPLLATAYRWIDDTTLEFELRKGVKFHDGSDFTAKDVVYTLNHAMKPDSGIVVRFTVDWIASVEVVDPYKIRIHAKVPTPAALEYLSGVTPIFPTGFYDKAPTVDLGGGKTRQDWGAVRPVCTGPYKMVEFEPGSHITLERFDGYFDGSPKGKGGIKRIVYRTIADQDTQVAELLTGGLDWIWNVPSANVEQLKTMGNLTITSAPTLRLSFLSIDGAGRSGKSPLMDARVRQAMAYAIDRKAIATELAGGGAAVLQSMCHPRQFGCTGAVKQYDYDPAKAKALLAEAGYPDGFDIPFYAYRDKRYSDAVVSYLRAVGIRPDFRYIQSVALRRLIVDGKAPLVHLTWGSQGMMDASASVSYHFEGTPDDYARDAELTGWLKQADASMDPEKRKALYAKALNRIADQAYYIPIFVYGGIYAYNADLDYPVTGDEIAHFYKARWK
ncbi:ABC transporter substrate-binding protein [Labrys neptuniae]